MQENQTAANNHSVPVLLFIGSEEETNSAINKHLCTALCIHGGCGGCSTCIHIEQHSHIQLYYHAYQAKHTLDSLEPLKEIVQFIPDRTPFFLVLERIDMFSAHAANSILKILEEPALGYQFIATALIEDSVLPTIRSRSAIIHCSKNEFNSLNTPSCLNLDTPIKFDQLEKQLPETPSERDVFITTLVHHLHKQAMEKSVNALKIFNTTLYEELKKITTLCEKIIQQLPIPGAERTILRTLAMALNEFHKTKNRC